MYGYPHCFFVKDILSDLRIWAGHSLLAIFTLDGHMYGEAFSTVIEMSQVDPGVIEIKRGFYVTFARLAIIFCQYV